MHSCSIVDFPCQKCTGFHISTLCAQHDFLFAQWITGVNLRELITVGVDMPLRSATVQGGR